MTKIMKFKDKAGLALIFSGMIAIVGFSGFGFIKILMNREAVSLEKLVILTAYTFPGLGIATVCIPSGLFLLGISVNRKEKTAEEKERILQLIKSELES